MRTKTKPMVTDKIFKLSFLITLFIIVFISCSEQSIVKNTSIDKFGIEQYVKKMIEVHDIPGMAVGVIYKDHMVHEGYYGYHSLQNTQPVNEKSIFKTFSLTKTIVATSIFQLEEQRKLNLDDTLSKFFSDMPLLWQSVTVGNLLSHSSGLPDVHNLMEELQNDSISNHAFIELLYEQPMAFVTNEQWSYNQTNYILLMMIIEQITGMEFQEFILKNQFSNSTSESVFFSSNPLEKTPNCSDYYEFDKKQNEYKTKPEFSGRKNLPLAGLNITLNEYINWNNKLDQGEILKGGSIKKMLTPYNYDKSNRKFTFGWDIHSVNSTDSYGFSGGSVSAFRKFIDKDLTIIVMMTGYKHYAIQDLMVNQIAGLVDPSLKDESENLTEELMADYFLKDVKTSLDNIYNLAKSKTPNLDLESVFSSIGYTLFFQLNRREEAIDIFKLNVRKHPDSADAYGSLGYLYFMSDKFELAKANYIKALEIDPNNTYSERRIKQINKILSDK